MTTFWYLAGSVFLGLIFYGWWRLVTAPVEHKPNKPFDCQIIFLLNDGSMITTLEQDRPLDEIVKSMTKVINYSTYFLLRYPRYWDAEGVERLFPERLEETPMLDAMISDYKVARISKQFVKREVKHADLV